MTHTLTRSYFPLLGIASTALLASACVVVSEPAGSATSHGRTPANLVAPAPAATTGTSSATSANSPPSLPATPATAAASSSSATVGGKAPPAPQLPHWQLPTGPSAGDATPSTTGMGPEGPHVSVNGHDFVTLSRPIAFGSGQNAAGAFVGYVYFFTSPQNQLPSFDALTPAGVLFTSAFAVDTASYREGFPGLDQGRNENFAIRYQGTFTTEKPGEYLFYLSGDQTARLFIDNAQVAFVSAPATTRRVEGHAKLSAGSHALRLEYAHGAPGGAQLVLHVVPPQGRGERPFAAAL